MKINTQFHQKQSNMHNGVGVRTARGTGTNGYVQGNRAMLPSYMLMPAQQSTRYNWESGFAEAKERIENPELVELEKQVDIEKQVYAIADERGLLDEMFVMFFCLFILVRMKISWLRL